MPLQIPDGSAYVVHRFQQTGSTREMLVTYGVSVDAGASVTVANALFAEFNTNWNTSLHTSYTHLGVIMRYGVASGDPIPVLSTSTAVAGTAGTDRLPPNNALLIRKQTGVGGRRNRGRMYLPGIVAESGVDSTGTISGLAGLQTIASAWLGDIVAVAGITQMVLLHSVGASTPTNVNELVVDGVVATQRRRLRR